MTAILNKLIFTFIVLSGFTTAAQQRVVITPAYPQRGDSVKVVFDPSAPGSAIPADATSVTLNFTYSNFYDLPWKYNLVKKDGKWEVTFKLQRWATFATFTLTSGEAVETPAPGKHYEIPVYDGRKPVLNGEMYRGYSLSAQMGRNPAMPAAQAAQYEKELSLYPDNYEAKLRLLAYNMNKAEGAEKEKLRAQAHKMIADKFYEAPTVMGTVNKATLGYIIIGESKRNDSLYKVVYTKYPDSEIGRDLWTDAVAKQNDTATQIALYEKALLKETPKNAKSFSGMHQNLFEYYTVKKNTQKALYHLGKIFFAPDAPYLPLYYKGIAQTLLENDIALDTAKKYAEKSLNLISRWPVGVIRTFPEYGHIYPAVEDSVRQAETNKATAMLTSMLGLIDMKQGRDAAAAEKISKAVAASHDKETLDNAALFYQLTARTEELNKLKAMREQELAVSIAKKRMSRPAPDMTTFLDMKGNPVTADVFRNKVVLVDFWATWCVPCMEEMPYIQNLYDQYKNNPDVVFMVVNSASNNKLEDAQKWKGNKKYSFPVYFANNPEVVSQFKFNIIPATYIIDRNGNIQFSNTGFEGPEVETKLRLQLEMVLKH